MYLEIIKARAYTNISSTNSRTYIYTRLLPHTHTHAHTHTHTQRMGEPT